MWPLSFSKAEDIALVVIIALLISILVYKHWLSVSPKSNIIEGLGITELIEKVKADLIKADENRLKAGQPALFEIKDFDLEINFVVKETRRGEGKIDYEVVAVGGGAEVSSERVQKIKLHMTANPTKKETQDATDYLPTGKVEVTGQVPPRASNPSPSPNEGRSRKEDRP